ncbi:MAG: GNAT family N-acetyltransferase [Bacteroidetes bacterium]|nr:MAG: GNAT family N-acetyltransferase [Bacteroidota bacterium]
MTSTKITLRTPELSDLSKIQDWENDKSLWYLSNTLLPFSRFSIEQYILSEQEDIFSKKQARFIISLTNIKNEELEIVGAIDLFDFDPKNRRAGVGILIEKAYRNKGYAKQALTQLIDYSFNILNLHQLYCSILTSNTKSLSLFKRQQFSIIGVKKDWVLLNNEWQDEYILQLINQKSI